MKLDCVKKEVKHFFLFLEEWRVVAIFDFWSKEARTQYWDLRKYCIQKAEIYAFFLYYMYAILHVVFIWKQWYLKTSGRSNN